MLLAVLLLLSFDNRRPMLWLSMSIIPRITVDVSRTEGVDPWLDWEPLQGCSCWMEIA